ncbi:DUF3515 domain-containing protein [Nocardioides sp. TRM66260-LWL]|uniref:DUF3515 domain-containing protein n=1 Tax=Nocardioides sp. TRM66260-LWL TaxID=2874478 RepID=UPI001CC3E5A6|nr:DUF3515 domain-containing protein [Nocardioides sp. TRM66260-LWL]MBZ5733137.1 DUF3515 domain-containing protein [Nocardioides sp. TRM66260-LWL]
MRPRRRAAALAAVTALLLAPALAGCGADAIDVDVPRLDDADAAACRALLDALPERLADLDRRDVSPSDAPARAWGDGLVLTCGAPQPDDFTSVSGCEEIRGVGWYVPPGEYADSSQDLTATAVGFRPRVSLRVPAAYRGDVSLLALSDLADPVRARLRLVQPCR